MSTPHLSPELSELTELFTSKDTYGWTNIMVTRWMEHDHSNGAQPNPELIEYATRLKQDGIGFTKDFAEEILAHLRLC